MPTPKLAALAVLLSVAVAPAQNGADDIAAREAAAKDDVAALLQVAEAARERGLLTEWRRILQRVLTLAPDHEAANRAVGNVNYEGRWMSPEKAEILRNRSEGLVSVNGVWVKEAEAEDARAGVFHFGGERVTKAEYLALRAGKVRHPRTGELIDAADLEKAKNNLFPDGQGGWIDEAEADRRHADLARPWVLRTKTCIVLGSMPLKELEQHAHQYVDDAYEFALTVFGIDVQPVERPVILLVPTADRFRAVGDQIGGPSSAYGAFLAVQPMSVPGLGAQVPAVALLDPNWGVYYLKHAVGLAVAHRIGENMLPEWVITGVGSYTERFYSREIANWFGKQFLGAGGLIDLSSWFRGFR
ncbi:MAG TPA: hypothetical protein VK081_09590, partial [Planctomycetota bacterium]|nr:hypothetical protein [Planctomycetota bacterium]